MTPTAALPTDDPQTSTPPPPQGDRPTGLLPGILLFLFLVGLAALSIGLMMRPPAPLPADAPADQFSATRAFAHVQALPAQPRQVGTQAHADAQAYLIAQLALLGLEPQIQKATMVKGALVVDVQNVLARLPGSSGTGKAVLLVAHYDSAPAGLGATDDGLGVASLLETARALKAQDQTLANDVIFFFSDGEDNGTLSGSAAFVREHPWAEDVGLVFSFDVASTGPLYTGKTSPDNGWLISQYAQAVPDALANSVAPEVVRHMPTTGDFDIFLEAGHAGIGFGSIGSSAYYHTVRDDTAGVDLRTLQHMGSYALPLVRHFGDLDLTTAHQGDAVFFNVLGAGPLVHYGEIWALPLAILTALVWVAALVLSLRGKQASLRGVLLGVLAALVVAVVLAGVGFLLWRLLLVIYPQYRPEHFEMGADTYNGRYYLLAFMALGVGLAALIHIGLRTRIRTVELALGGLLLWSVMAAASSVGMPGVSCVLTWPALFGSLGLWGWLALGRTRVAGVWRTVLLAVLLVPAVAMVAPFTCALSLALSIQEVWVSMAVLGLGLGLLAIPLAIMAQPRRLWLPALMGLLASGFLMAGHITSDYTAARPLRDGVYYGLDADQAKAYWLGTFGTEIDPWTEQFFMEDGVQGDHRDIFPWEHEAEFYQAPAPAAELPGPTAEQLMTTASGALRVHITPAANTWVLDVFTMPGPVPGTVFYVDDEPIESDGLLVYYAPPAEGFDLTVESPDTASLTLRLVGVVPGLPTLADFTYTPRPDWIIPDTGGMDSSTVVATDFAFGME